MAAVITAIMAVEDVANIKAIQGQPLTQAKSSIKG